MTPRFLKRNGILLVTWALFVIAVIGFGIGIDQLIYQKEKQRLYVPFNVTHLFPHELPGFMSVVDQWANEVQSGTVRDETLASLKKAAHQVVQGPDAVYRVVIKLHDGKLIFDEQKDKFEQFNDFSNCLWIRRFSNQRVRDFDAPGGRNTVWMYVTTPPTNSGYLETEIKRLQSIQAPSAEIDALLSRIDKLKALESDLRNLTSGYRRITIYIALLLLAFTLIFIRTLVLPVRNVIASIEDSTAKATRFIPSPTSRLERLYNDMARFASLSRLNERQSAIGRWNSHQRLGMGANRVSRTRRRTSRASNRLPRTC